MKTYNLIIRTLTGLGNINADKAVTVKAIATIKEKPGTL